MGSVGEGDASGDAGSGSDVSSGDFGSGWTDVRRLGESGKEKGTLMTTVECEASAFIPIPLPGEFGSEPLVALLESKDPSVLPLTSSVERLERTSLAVAR